MIDFNVPFLTGGEQTCIEDAIKRKTLSGDGHYTHLCHEWLQTKLETNAALLTHSCTAALEMAAILLDLQPGDEVIVPSFTFVSSANAIVLRGAVPVFVDVRSDNFNIDESLIEAAITPRTKAILVVHYAGVPCEMDAILDIARRYKLYVVEDAAQALLSKYNGKYLGTIGDIGCLSFHATKNVIAGEGGAILLNNADFVMRAEIIREKGTNRRQFFRGQTDKYTWVDIGSSYLPSELIAAFLYPQLCHAEEVTSRRRNAWQRYYQALSERPALNKLLSLPKAIRDTEHNAHMFPVTVANAQARDPLIAHLKKKGISAVFHYVPLHSSTAGLRFGRVASSMECTNFVAESIVRLPMWVGVEEHVDYIAECIEEFFR